MPGGWDDPEARASSADEPGSAGGPPAASGWHDPQAAPPRRTGSGASNIFGMTDPYEPEDPRHSYDPHEAPEAYDPLTSTRPDGGGSNGHRPPSTRSRDFRVAGGTEPDPLTDDRIDAADAGTPLADESWDSIRRGFDRLKDASNWESLAKGDFHDSDDLPAADAFDETAAMPIVDLDEDDDGSGGGGRHGGGGRKR